jgi:EAL domain-containing protein (putative c-di-GMP-specific phosphodiesterase class I)
VRDIPQDRNDMEIAATIIAMAHTLKLRVVAEGVETPEQLAFLKERECDAWQGYLYSKPCRRGIRDAFPAGLIDDSGFVNGHVAKKAGALIAAPIGDQRA